MIPKLVHFGWHFPGPVQGASEHPYLIKTGTPDSRPPSPCPLCRHGAAVASQHGSSLPYVQLALVPGPSRDSALRPPRRHGQQGLRSTRTLFKALGERWALPKNKGTPNTPPKYYSSYQRNPPKKGTTIFGTRQVCPDTSMDTLTAVGTVIFDTLFEMDQSTKDLFSFGGRLNDEEMKQLGLIWKYFENLCFSLFKVLFLSTSPHLFVRKPPTPHPLRPPSSTTHLRRAQNLCSI